MKLKLRSQWLDFIDWLNTDWSIVLIYKLKIDRLIGYLQIPDIAASMTGGCAGYASTYMKWPEELILGGVRRNSSGHLQR